MCQIRGSGSLQLANGLLHGVHDLAGADHGGDLVHVQIDGAVLVHEGDLAADHVIGGLGALAQLGAVLKVGGLGGAPNRKVVFQNITLDDPDVETLEYLKGKGADIIFQTIPEDTPMKLDDILKRYK